MKYATKVIAALLLAGGVAAGALAADAVRAPLQPADTRAAFERQAAAARAQMRPHGRYEYVDPQERGEVEQGLAHMDALFSRYGDVASMPQDARVALLNDQERVNGILMHNDIDRLVCQHVAPLGSRIPKTECRTYGQIMREREGARESMQTLNQTGRAINGANSSGG